MVLSWQVHDGEAAVSVRGGADVGGIGHQGQHVPGGDTSYGFTSNTAHMSAQLARICLDYSCFSRPAEIILAKCARFLKVEISRNFGFLKLLGKEDYEIFQVSTFGSE